MKAKQKTNKIGHNSIFCDSHLDMRFSVDNHICKWLWKVT